MIDIVLEQLSTSAHLVLYAVALVPLLGALVYLRGRIGGEGGLDLDLIHIIIGTLLVPAFAIFTVHGIITDPPVTAFMGLLVGFELDLLVLRD